MADKVNDIFFGQPIEKEGQRSHITESYFDDELSVSVGGGTIDQSYGGDAYYTPLSHLADDREKFKEFEKMIKDKHMIPKLFDKKQILDMNYMHDSKTNSTVLFALMQGGILASFEIEKHYPIPSATKKEDT